MKLCNNRQVKSRTLMLLAYVVIVMDSQAVSHTEVTEAYKILQPLFKGIAGQHVDVKRLERKQ